MRFILNIKFQAKDIRVSETDFNMEFVARIIPKLDWNTLWQAADKVRYVFYQNLIHSS